MKRDIFRRWHTNESEWGKHGWTHLTLAAAQEQFDTLANQAGGIAA